MRIYLLLLLVCLQFSAQQTAANVDEIIHREMNERKIPGLKMAVVQNGKIVLNRSYGIANLQYNLPVSNPTIFPITPIQRCSPGLL